MPLTSAPSPERFAGSAPADFAAWEQEYTDWERQQRELRDEITDQAERLAAPMAHAFEYELRADGLYSDLNERFATVLEDGLQVAEHKASIDPCWEFEVRRRRIELEELAAATTFARQHDGGVRISSISLDQSNYKGMRAIAEHFGLRLPLERPDSETVLQNRMRCDVPPALVVMSPIPDAVRLQGVNIGAYDTKRQKMLVRIITPQSQPKEIQARFAEDIRSIYDASLHDQFGGEWYAGRQGGKITVKNAKAFIEMQEDLLSDHMAIVRDVFAATADKDERLRLLASPRYNLSAALDDRLHGRTVTSLSDSGDTARAEGRSFDGDCPTSMASAAQQAETLGYTGLKAKEVLECVNCPFCKKVVKAVKKHTAKEQSIECQACFAKVDTRTGERIDAKPRLAAKKLGAKAVKLAKVVELKKLGKEWRLHKRVVVGGVVREYIHAQTGERKAA